MVVLQCINSIGVAKRVCGINIIKSWRYFSMNKPIPLNELRSIYDMLSLKNKKAFVTGAGGGIGRSSAAALAELGADVAIMGRPSRQQTLNEIAEFIAKKHGVRVITVTGDISNEESVRKMYAEIVAEFGTIDIIYSNAGITTLEDNPDMDLALWQRVLDNNYTGMLLVAREGAKIMKAHGHGGSIILTASMSGQSINRRPEGQRYSVAYTSTKAAVRHLAKALAMDYVKYNIRVNSISPGYIWSGLHDTFPQERLDYMASTVPMQRFGTLNEVIGSIAFLASDLSSYQTGSDIVFDGGYCVW
jgi:sorbose reductase